MQITLIWEIIAHIYGECPKADLLKPCLCDKDVISCGGHNSINLKNIFHNLSTILKSDKKHLKGFFLNNTEVNELPENIFEDIIFETISIRDSKKFAKIHTKAFAKFESHIKDIYVYNTSLKSSPPDYDLFTALSSMANLETIFITNSMIEEIPDNAFRPLNGPQNKLYDIGLEYNKIKKFGNNAFKNLHFLNGLDLDHNSVNHIPKDAFSFNTTSKDIFDLYLQNLTLNSNSFEKGAFSNLNRPTFLHFNYGYQYKSNNITYLDQHIFEEFLNKNNYSKIELYTIDCKDCRSFWLVKNDKFKPQIDSIRCSDLKPLTDENSFSGCEHFV